MASISLSVCIDTDALFSLDADPRLVLADLRNMLSSFMYMVFCWMFYNAVSIQAWGWQHFDNVRAAITHNARLQQHSNILAFKVWPLLPY
jgi:hypothetical protein